MPLGVEPSNKARIDPELKEECKGVVNVPHEDLSLTQATRLWAIDRSSLGECKQRHNELVKSVEVIER